MLFLVLPAGRRKITFSRSFWRIKTKTSPAYTAFANISYIIQCVRSHMRHKAMCTHSNAYIMGELNGPARMRHLKTIDWSFLAVGKFCCVFMQEWFCNQPTRRRIPFSWARHWWPEPIIKQRHLSNRLLIHNMKWSCEWSTDKCSKERPVLIVQARGSRSNNFCPPPGCMELKYNAHTYDKIQSSCFTYPSRPNTPNIIFFSI